MAVCCICNKKIGRHDNSYVLSTKYAELILCDGCNVQKQKLQVNTEGNLETIRESRQYFEDYLAINMVAVPAKEPLRSLLQASKEAEEESLKYQRKNRSLLATTGYSLEGYRIVEYRDVVSGEVVLGTGSYTELGRQISDITGKTCEIIAGKINAAKEQALFNLKHRAMLEGGNAVIGVSYNVVNLADNMLVVSAYGTAVYIESNMDKTE